MAVRYSQPVLNRHADADRAVAVVAPSAGSSGKRTRAAVAVALAVAGAFALDQASKAWALSALSGGTTVPILPSFELRLVFNPGVAFGIGADAGAPLVVGLMVLNAVLLGWVCARVVRDDDLVGTALLAIAAGGGLGNLWDRIFRAGDLPLTGRVVDFIAVDWFAIFNVADIFTTCGIALWALRTTLLAGSDRRAAATQVL